MWFSASQSMRLRDLKPVQWCMTKSRYIMEIICTTSCGTEPEWDKTKMKSFSHASTLGSIGGCLQLSPALTTGLSIIWSSNTCRALPTKEEETLHHQILESVVGISAHTILLSALTFVYQLLALPKCLWVPGILESVQEGPNPPYTFPQVRLWSASL